MVLVRRGKLWTFQLEILKIYFGAAVTIAHTIPSPPPATRGGGVTYDCTFNFMVKVLILLYRFRAGCIGFLNF